MTGEKEKRACNYKMHDDKPCARPLYDGENCIFHSKDIKGKKRDFNDIFWPELARQRDHDEYYDFSGFVFPGEISLGKIEFEKDVYFYDVIFSGHAVFWGARFSGKAAFERPRFIRRVAFERVQFTGEAAFGGAQFRGEAGFRKVKFSE